MPFLVSSEVVKTYIGSIFPLSYHFITKKLMFGVILLAHYMYARPYVLHYDTITPEINSVLIASILCAYTAQKILDLV